MSTPRLNKCMLNWKKKATICKANFLASLTGVLIRKWIGFRCEKSWGVRWFSWGHRSHFRSSESALISRVCYSLCPNSLVSHLANTFHMTSVLQNLDTETLTLIYQKQMSPTPVPSGPCPQCGLIWKTKQEATDSVKGFSSHPVWGNFSLVTHGPSTCNFLSLGCFLFHQPGHTNLASRSA